MRLVPLGVAVVAATLFLSGLGTAPLIDPPEGFHAEIAREMIARGDLVTPRFNGVPHVDEAPLLYWLIWLSSAVSGPTPFAARLWPALAAIGIASATAYLGVLLAGPRAGLLAGLMVAANLGIFVFGRFVQPDLVFVVCIVLAYVGFVLTYLGRGRWPLALFYASLGFAALAKDVVGALGPLVAVAIFFWLTGERPLRPWMPWWGVGLLGAIALPWHVLMELRHRGFLWHTIVDQHLLSFTRARAFPDEDSTLGSMEFLIVTIVAFLPWALALPAGALRIVRGPRESATDRVWLLLGVWAALVVGFFMVAPFSLAHSGLAAFPVLALIAARTWDEAIARAPDGVRPLALLAPVVIVFGAVTATLAAVWFGLLPTARDELAAFAPVLPGSTLMFLVGVVSLKIATRRRLVGGGLAVALATVLGFLPLVGNGTAELARIRSARPIADALTARRAPGDLVMHEGALENSGSALLRLAVPIPVVDGRPSSGAFGVASAEAREIFWDAPRARDAWARPGRHFLISVVAAERSVVRAFPPERVHVLVDQGGRRLYSSQPDPR